MASRRACLGKKGRVVDLMEDTASADEEDRLICAAAPAAAICVGENTGGPHFDGLCRGAHVEALLHRGELPPFTVVGPNAHLVTLAGRDSRFAEAMRDADLAVPDGVSIVMASRVAGRFRFRSASPAAT